MCVCVNRKNTQYIKLIVKICVKNNKVIDYLCKVFPMIKENYNIYEKYTNCIFMQQKNIPDIRSTTDTHSIV